MKLNIAIIFGGKSPEHEISIISANQAMHALNKDKYNLIPIYISKSQKFYTGNDLLNLKNYSNLSVLESKLTNINIVRIDNKTYINSVNKSLFNKGINEVIDIAIPVMHGLNGEDGNLAGYLNMLNIPFAGCDTTSAAVGQDKVIQKCIIDTNSISTCPWFWLYEFDFDDNQEHYCNKANDLGYPVIIKPSKLGSSIGIKIAHNKEEFIEYIKECGQYDSKLLIEKAIKNLVEINISILGNTKKYELSVTEQVVKNDEILSFTDKYQGNGKGSKSKGTKSKGMASTSRIVPAPIAQEQIKFIEDQATKAFKALGCSGVCRIDFMLDKDTNNIYLTEVNTIPGSLAFYLWKEKNVEFDELLDKLISIAIDNKRSNEKLLTSFDTNILKTFG